MVTEFEIKFTNNLKSLVCKSIDAVQLRCAIIRPEEFDVPCQAKPDLPEPSGEA
jgi:hypothetical protein